MAVNKLELLVLSALFLSPFAVIVTKCAEAPSLFALHPAANALAFLVLFPAYAPHSPIGSLSDCSQCLIVLSAYKL